jgi:hypothetical protein
MKLKPPSPGVGALALACLLACTLDLGLPRDARAQYNLPATFANTTEDNDSALIVRYVGAQPSGTIEVASGDLLFKHGALAAEIADTTITGCGGTAGTLDVDTTCTTLGVTLDRCNASANWRCVRLDGLRSDSDSGAKLLTLAATQATPEDGVLIKWDTSVAFHTTRLLAPPIYRSMRAYLGTGTALNANPWLGRTTCVQYMNGTSTYASGTSTIQFLSEQPSFGVTESAPTVNINFSVAGGATTANKVITDFVYTPLCMPQNERTLIRILNSAAMSVPTLVGGGKIVPNGY